MTLAVPLVNERDHGLTGILFWTFVLLAGVVLFYVGRDWWASRGIKPPPPPVSGAPEVTEPPPPGASPTLEAVSSLPPILIQRTGRPTLRRPSKSPPAPAKKKTIRR